MTISRSISELIVIGNFDELDSEFTRDFSCFLFSSAQLSYLVSEQVMEANIRQKKIVSLGDLTKMLKLKFSTFSEMKKLVKLKNKKGLKDVVKSRSSIKMSVSQQMRELKTCDYIDLSF